MAEDTAAAGGAAEAKTQLDVMIELLKSKGRQEAGAIATALGESYETVERWAKVLEENGIVQIKHEVGKMYIEPTTITQSAAAEETAEFRYKTTQAIVDNRIRVAEQQLKLYAGLAAELDKERKKIYGILAGSAVFGKIAELNKEYMTIKGYGDSLENTRREAQASFQRAIGEFDSAINKGAALDAGDAAAKAQRIDAIRKEAQAALEQHRRELRRLLESSLAEATALYNQLGEETRRAESALAMRRRIEESAGIAVSRIERQKRAFIDRFEKLNDVISQKGSVIAAKTAELDNAMEQLKGVTGKAMELSQRYNELSNGISTARRQIGEARAELAALRRLNSGLKASKRSAKEKSLKSDEIAEKSKQMMGRLSKLADMIGSVGEHDGGAQRGAEEKQ